MFQSNILAGFPNDLQLPKYSFLSKERDSSYLPSHNSEQISKAYMVYESERSFSLSRSIMLAQLIHLFTPKVPVLAGRSVLGKLLMQ